MAEAAGLAVGVVALVGLVENCIRLFDYIHAAKSFGSSADVLCVRLDIQKLRLLHWINRVRFLQPDYDKRLDEHNNCAAVRKTLECLRNLLNDTESVRRKHGLVPSLGSDGRYDFLSGPRSKDLLQQIQNLKLTDQIRVVPKSSLRGITWAVKDEKRFGTLVENIKELVDGLDAVVPDEDHCLIRLLSREDIQRIDNPGRLNLIVTAVEAAEDRVKDDAVAEEAFIKQAEDRVLDVLWFHEMRARKASINPAYARTFEWALSPESGIHCSLPEWLSSGSGTYWVQGKPGSGKSTLLRFLAEKTSTNELLSKDLTEGKELLVVSFFFWALGSKRQKSREGLFRSVLHQILGYCRSLIPTLLPDTWQECRRNPKASSPALLEIEMEQSLLRLADMNELPFKLCLIVDGLDEYDGCLLSSIELFQKLALNPQIKMLLSSRPIGPCADAFSNFPGLRMQDLTREDMAIYIDGTIMSHTYIAGLERRHPGALQRLKHDLLDKASGVFLWLELACRSLRNGFASRAKLSELQRRVDELPPELEELFQHILGRLDPRHTVQAAELLRMMFANQVATAKPEPFPVHALSLAMLDHQDLALEPSPAVVHMTNREARELRHDFKRRLQAYCGGLLEIHETTSAQSNDPRASTIQFMHRTVFEFLSIPGIFEIECMRTRDNTFNPHCLLIWVLWDFILNHKHGLESMSKEAQDKVVNTCFVQLNLADHTSWRVAHEMLQHLGDLRVFRDARRLHGPRKEGSQASMDIILAVEAGIRWYLESHPSQHSWRKAHGSRGYSLSHHARTTPVLKSSHILTEPKPDMEAMIRLLDSPDPCTQDLATSVKSETEYSFPVTTQKRRASDHGAYTLDDAALRKKRHKSTWSSDEGSSHARGEGSSSETRAFVGTSDIIEISDDEVGDSEGIELSDDKV